MLFVLQYGHATNGRNACAIRHRLITPPTILLKCAGLRAASELPRHHLSSSLQEAARRTTISGRHTSGFPNQTASCKPSARPNRIYANFVAENAPTGGLTSHRPDVQGSVCPAQPRRCGACLSGLFRAVAGRAVEVAAILELDCPRRSSRPASR
jgi:hypothetical protein